LPCARVIINKIYDETLGAMEVLVSSVLRYVFGRYDRSRVVTTLVSPV